ncbi:MAG: PilZ domain-containing protein [Desulfobacterales bacterium]
MDHGHKIEKRRHVRTVCVEDTHLASKRRLFEGTILNLSKGGVYLKVRGHFAEGQKIVVAGPFDEDGSEVKRYGKVVRTDGSGIGVEFSDPHGTLRR